MILPLLDLGEGGAFLALKAFGQSTNKIPDI